MFSNPREEFGKEVVFRSLYHATSLAFELISEKGTLSLICAGLLHPFFDAASDDDRERARTHALVYTSVASTAGKRHCLDPLLVEESNRLLKVNDEQAEQIIQNIAAELTARITDTSRKARWQSGMLTSLDFSGPSLVNRYQWFLSNFSPERLPGQETLKTLAELISEHQAEIERRVVGWYEGRLIENAHIRPEVDKELEELAKEGAFSHSPGREVPSTFSNRSELERYLEVGKILKELRVYLHRSGSVFGPD